MSAFSSRQILNRDCGRVYILTQFRTSIDHVGRVYFHVTNIQFHANVLDSHVTLSVLLDGIASQKPRTSYIIYKRHENKIYKRECTNQLAICIKKVRYSILTRRYIEYAFAHDRDLTDSSFTLEFTGRYHFWHVKIYF